MSSSSFSSYSMPPPPLPAGIQKTPISVPVDPASGSDSEPDSDSDTVTATPSHHSSPRDSRNLNQGSKALEAMSSTFLLEDLKVAVSGYHATASYCLGGRIPIKSFDIGSRASFVKSEKGKGRDRDGDGDESQGFESAKAPITSPPVTIRFDTPSSPTAAGSNPEILVHKITFPIPNSKPGNKKAQTDALLVPLLTACTPTTFDNYDHNIVDETHYQPGIIDAENFSTNFHPADLGILDAVRQVLLPGLLETGDGALGMGREDHCGVRADLSRLEVYSNPSGTFQTHFNTPQNTTQLGSLVVCLPCPHEGGQLLLSHEGHVSVFDWSTSSSNSSPADENAIQWCAFNSDCEHEVLPVTLGHRVTLTYNLYVSEYTGGILQRYPTADPYLYPLFEGAKKMTEMPDFMKKGGILGFYCAHQYAHTHKSTDQLMPYALKGIDAIVFAVFRSLGAKVRVRPVLDNDAWEMEDEEYDHEYEKHPGYIEGEGHASWRARRAGITRFGSRFEGITLTYAEGGDPLSEKIADDWPLVEIRDVQWLNEATATGWEAAMVQARFCDEPCLSWHHSHAAILIDVPPRGKRKAIPETGFEYPDWKRETDADSKSGMDTD